MQPDEFRASSDETQRRSSGHAWNPATVITYRPFDGRGGIAVIRPDGGDATLEAANVTGVPLNPLDRVQWVHDPPAGVYVVGVITTPESTGSCEPMAVRCHVSLGCGGYEYFPDTGDYEIGGATIEIGGLSLPAPGVWHIGFNMHGTASTGSSMGQGLLRVSDLSCTYEYGITSSFMDPGDFSWITANGAVDHAVPPNTFGAVLTVDAWGGTTSLVFMSGFVGVLYAHRIECTADLLEDGSPCG